MPTNSDLQHEIQTVKSEIKTLSRRIDDLTDMKLVLVELKTISEYQAKRLDRFEEELNQANTTNKIPVSDIIRYTLFTGLGVVVTSIITIIIK